jgi:hypothetical protein
VVTDDWVKKGCHIHVEGVELSICPDHRHGITFKAVFSTTPEDEVEAAIKIARDKCLPDKDTRLRWIRDIKRATLFMLNYEGELRNLANGRMLEFKFLVLALERYKE